MYHCYSNDFFFVCIAIIVLLSTRFSEATTPRASTAATTTSIVNEKEDANIHSYDQDVISVETGTPFVIWDTQDTKCNDYHKPLDLPDVPARAFVDNRNVTHLITADTTSWISYGPSILDVTRNCTIAYNATFDPQPEKYAADEFIDATYSFGNGTVVGLLHTEYPGMNFQNCHADKPSYPKCWMVSIGMAVSSDWGYSWHHVRPPPHHLVASVPYKYDPSGTNLAYGWGDTSGIVRNPRDGYFYVAMMNRNRIGLQSNGTCVMRTKTLLEPKSWRGWNGSDFSVSFMNPYDDRDDENHKSDGDDDKSNIENHVCTVLDSLPPNCNMLGVTYSTYLRQFVGSLWCPFTHQGNVSPRHEFLFTTSYDMIHWSPAQTMFDPFHEEHHNPHLQNAAYPTLMDVNAPIHPRNDMNFETIGQQATLFYVQITHNFFKEGRQLMGVNVTFHNRKVSHSNTESVTRN
mmetsp:Transcript_29291/g.44971  ORF Transcript_29291/g.44971 Transcript_29291/m.44971 type:complete len:460 (+) Transcript_29291:148-1527(+)|eukprot:CAMPEP_0195289228 /NCGR_PEP_ID=MMETSP0707-20130614/5597_1 /TAXON_ID=33640 /ORGANISM="Asterionellopsis glacialis, Strain CCMP134" /LENGTH=459 /DNA_ID=CAMNT_0040349207 /DNA_START=144 /DNA_END=1523 /DNA_ORIENTATION=+